MRPGMNAIFDLELSEGRMLTESDVDRRANIAVVGMDVVENLMPGVDPLGKEIRVEGQPYQVVGVAKRQGKTLGQSRDNWVGIPITSYLKQYGSHTSLRISSKANGVGADLDRAMDGPRSAPRARRREW